MGGGDESVGSGFHRRRSSREETPGSVTRSDLLQELKSAAETTVQELTQNRATLGVRCLSDRTTSLRRLIEAIEAVFRHKLLKTPRSSRADPGIVFPSRAGEVFRTTIQISFGVISMRYSRTIARRRLKR